MKKRREMNPAAKRTAIMAASEQLFATKGYTNTSMAEIARAANVAVGTLYRLFPDKPSLLAALHAAMEERFITAMMEGWHRKDAYREKFAPMLEALFDEAEAVRETMPLYAMTQDMMGVTDYQPGVRMIAAIEKMYAEGVQAGAYRQMSNGLVGPLAHAMVEGGMRAFMIQPTKAWRNEIVKELEQVFLKSFT